MPVRSGIDAVCIAVNLMTQDHANPGPLVVAVVSAALGQAVDLGPCDGHGCSPLIDPASVRSGIRDPVTPSAAINVVAVAVWMLDDLVVGVVRETGFLVVGAPRDILNVVLRYVVDELSFLTDQGVVGDAILDPTVLAT